MAFSKKLDNFEIYLEDDTVPNDQDDYNYNDNDGQVDDASHLHGMGTTRDNL